MQGAEDLRGRQSMRPSAAAQSSTDEYDSVCLGQRERETVKHVKLVMTS